MDFTQQQLEKENEKLRRIILVALDVTPLSFYEGPLASGEYEFVAQYKMPDGELLTVTERLPGDTAAELSEEMRSLIRVRIKEAVLRNISKKYFGDKYEHSRR